MATQARQDAVVMLVRKNPIKRLVGKVSTHIFNSLRRWSSRRYSEKGKIWVQRKYYRTKGHQHRVFSATIENVKGKKAHLDLVEICKTPIRRHIKIIAEATPYDPAHLQYFAQRQTRRKEKRLSLPCKSSWSSWWDIDSSNDE